MNIFHRLISAVSDSGIPGQVSSNAWNAALDIKRSISADSIVNAGCCSLSICDFEINSGVQLEIAADGCMEIL